jgi:hypothetical protein
LTDLKCSSSDADWNKYPDWEVRTGNVMNAELIHFLSIFEGHLMYKLKRKNVKSHDQPKSTHIRLLLVWKSKGHNGFCVFAHLIERDTWFLQHEAKLEEYHQRYTNQFCTYTGPIEDTWLIDDVILMTRLELNFTQRNSRLDLTISEGIWDSYAKKPEWIDPKM